MKDRGGCESGGARWAGLLAGVLAVMAAVVIGCGSGGGSNIAPFAGVWVANPGGPDVLHFSGAQINQFRGVFNLPPATLLTTRFISPQDTLFDSAGGLWVVDGGSGRGAAAAVYNFAAAQLANLNSNSAPTPAFVATAPFNFVFPQFAAFDGAGNLWVTDSGGNQILEFTKEQLASPTHVATSPNAVLSSLSFSAPLGMAFDAAGNLWVANNGTTPSIIEIAAATLAAASGPTAVVPIKVLTSTLVDGFQTINNPWGMLFDVNGNLWFTNEQSNVGVCSGTIVEFTAAALAAPGIFIAPPPNVVITPASAGGNMSLCDPNGIAMNSAGDITVANAGNNSLAEYTAQQLMSSGATVPNLLVVGVATTLQSPAGLVYGPLSLH